MKTLNGDLRAAASVWKLPLTLLCIFWITNKLLKITYPSAGDTSRFREPASGSFLKVLSTLLLQQNEDFHPRLFSSQYWPIAISTSTWMWGHESVTQNSTHVSNPENIFGHAFSVTSWNSGPSRIMLIKFKVPNPNPGCTSFSMSSNYAWGGSISV